MAMKLGLSCLGWEVGRPYGMCAGEASNFASISSHVVEKKAFMERTTSRQDERQGQESLTNR